MPGPSLSATMTRTRPRQGKGLDEGPAGKAAAMPASPQPLGMAEGSPSMFRILSIDGGGIRGVIPAMVLTAIEEKAGRPIADLFDLIAGTSTGGIIAVGLAVRDDRGKPRFSA